MKRLVLLLVLASCLSKPDKPGVSGDGGIGDGSMDTPPPCATGGPFPENFVMERKAQTLRFDDDAAEDLLVFGHVEKVGRAYIVLGRTPMALDCYDHVITATEESGDLTAAWAGEITGDGYTDVVLLLKTPSQLVVELHPSMEAGFVAPTVSRIAYADHGWTTNNFGGSDDARAPVFLDAISTLTGRELVFGGIEQPFATAAINNEVLGPILPGTGASGVPFNLYAPTEAMWPYTLGGAPGRMLLTPSGGGLVELTHDATTPTYSGFIEGRNAGLDGGNRTVRTWHRPFTSTTQLAINETTEGYALIGFDTAAGFRVSTLAASADLSAGQWAYDVGILAIGDPTRPDIVGLFGAMPPGDARKLTIHREIALSDGAVNSMDSSATTDIAGTSLATGDFDGNPATDDQVLVLGSPTNGTSIGACYELRIASDCIVACGTTNCLD